MVKRRIAFLTAFMIFALALSSFAAPFSDMPKSDSVYYSAVEYAAAKGILNGDGGKLMADSPVTRAQAAAFLTRALGFSKKADISSLKDVKSGDWYADSAATVIAAGLISPANGSFMPDKTLTKKEAAIILSKAYGLGFEEKDIDKLYALLTGSSDKAGDLSKAVSRGDFILWLYNAVKAAPAEKASEPASESVSESVSAPTEAETKSAYELAAEEAMRLALGIRADGTSYIEKNVVYRDGGHSMDWKDTGGSSGSKRPTTPSKPTKPIEKPTEPEEPTEPSTDKPTEPPTEPQTEPPQEDYTGPIDNDKDNVIDDPFGDDDGDNNDSEDDFNFNDADDPTDKPSEKPSEDPSEDVSEKPSEEPSDEPSEDVSEEPSDETSEDVSEEPSEEQSEETSEEPSEDVSEEPSDEPSEETSEESSEEPSEEQSEESTEEPFEEAGEPEEGESEKTDLFGGFNILTVFKRDGWFI